MKEELELALDQLTSEFFLLEFAVAGVPRFGGVRIIQGWGIYLPSP